MFFGLYVSNAWRGVTFTQCVILHTVKFYTWQWWWLWLWCRLVWPSLKEGVTATSWITDSQPPKREWGYFEKGRVLSRKLSSKCCSSHFAILRVIRCFNKTVIGNDKPTNIFVFKISISIRIKPTPSETRIDNNSHWSAYGQPRKERAAILRARWHSLSHD